MSRVSPLRASVATGLTLGTAAVGLAFAPAALAAGLTAPTAPATAVAGQEFTVSGAGCVTDDAAHPDYEAFVAVITDLTDLEDPDAEILIADPTDAGDWSLPVSFPAGTTGQHEVWATCAFSYVDDPTDYPAVTVNVAATSPTTPSTSASSPTTATPAATTAPTGALRGTSANTPGVVAQTSGASTGTKAAPGQKVVRVLTGFKPFEKVTVTLHSTPQTLGTFTADAQGVVIISFTLPAGTPAGGHDLAYEGNMGTYFQESFTVAASTSSADGSLAYTGTSVALPLALGTGLLAVGGGALLVTRRRSAGAAQA